MLILRIRGESILRKPRAPLAVALFGVALLSPAAHSDEARVPVPGAPAGAQASSPRTEAPEQDIGGLAEAAAEADLLGAAGSSLSGNARFEQTEAGVTVLVEIEGASPGKKGIHVHEKGDCSDLPGKSMGEHFAPRSEPHGLPESPRRHIGDLGNIVVDESGRGSLEIVATGANLEKEDPLSFLNRAIVIHRGEDKGTQPSGDSGAPLACGVIEEG